MGLELEVYLKLTIQNPTVSKVLSIYSHCLSGGYRTRDNRTEITQIALSRNDYSSLILVFFFFAFLVLKDWNYYAQPEEELYSLYCSTEIFPSNKGPERLGRASAKFRNTKWEFPSWRSG